MPLIDVKYFIGPINIPNAGTGGPLDSQLKYFIQNMEVKFLRSALGIPLYNAFTVALGLNADGDYDKVTDGLADVSVEQRFKDLLNGKEYTDMSNRTQKWMGFISLSDGSRPFIQSPIAHYVYFYFMRENANPTTTIGVVQPSAENSLVVSPRQKLSTVWNQMREQIEALVSYLENNQSVYTEWTYRDGIEAKDKFRFLNPFF